MAQGDIFFEHRHFAWIPMENCPILDIAMGTNHDRFDVAPDDRTVPDACSLADLDVTDDGGIGGNEGGLAQIWGGPKGNRMGHRRGVLEKMLKRGIGFLGVNLYGSYGPWGFRDTDEKKCDRYNLKD